MQTRRSQRGFLLIAAVILIAIASAMAVAIATLTAGSGDAGSEHVNSTQSFFAAESGIERALYGYTKEATACASLSYNGSVAIGSDTAAYSTMGMLHAPTPTTLSSAITSTATTIPLSANTGYAAHGQVQIGAELLQYAGLFTSASVCGVGVAACLTGVTRGTGGTTAAAAAAGANVIQYTCLIRSTGTFSGNERTIDRAIFAAYGGAMIAYVKETSLGTPFIRLWAGASWGTETTANTVGAQIRFIVLKASPIRREYILVTQNVNGQIHAQTWNGNAWTAIRLLGTVGTAGERDQRAFDVEYESSSGRAVVVYRNNNNVDPDMQIWNGATWSATVTVTENGNNGRPVWIEMAPHPSPTSNDIAFITINNNNDIDALTWNGTGWSQMGNVGASLDTSAAPFATQVIDVEYEAGGAQRAMFVWLDNNNCTGNFRTWDGAALSGAATFTNWTDCNTRGLWVRLAADPFSDDILVGIQEVDDDATDTNETAPPNQDTNSDVGTCFWNGAVWSCAVATQPEHVYDPEAPSGNSRIFDIGFTTDPSRAGEAWLMWGALAGGGTNIWRKSWTTGIGWQATPTVVGGPDLCVPQLVPHPNTGMILVGMYEDADTGDVSAMQYSNGAWSGAVQQLWNGGSLDCQAGTRVHERVAVAVESSALTAFDWTEYFPQGPNPP